MTTPSGNYQFSFNGWAFGGLGQGVQVLSVEGLEDMPTLRTQDDTRGFNDGQFTGRDFLNGRSIVFTLQIMNDSANTMQTYLSQLKTNLMWQQSGTGTLQFQLPGRSVQRVSARVRRRSIKIDPDYVYGRAEAVIEMFCPDPRIYADTAKSAVLNPTTSRGRIYNRTYNLTYTVASGSGTSSSVVANSGNVTVYPTITLAGQITNPVITNSTTGDFIALQIGMATLDTLVIDTDLRSITYNGNPARNILTNASTWISLAPGNSTLGIVASAADPTSTCTISFRDGYV